MAKDFEGLFLAVTEQPYSRSLFAGRNNSRLWFVSFRLAMASVVENVPTTVSSAQINGSENIPTDPSSPNVSERIIICDDDLANLTTEKLTSLWNRQNAYIDSLEEKIQQLQSDLSRVENEKKEKLLECTRRENLLLLTVSCKERQISQLNEQLSDVRRLQLPNECQLRSTLLDPAVNLLFERMKKEVSEAKMKVEETENELSAWKFTPDSNTGKRLMAKCRMLYQENEELGKVISSGRFAKLEGELELQKELCGNIEKSQSEIEDLVLELEENNLALQSTIINFQNQIKELKESRPKESETSSKAAPDNTEEPSSQAVASVGKANESQEADEPPASNVQEDDASSAKEHKTNREDTHSLSTMDID